MFVVELTLCVICFNLNIFLRIVGSIRAIGQRNVSAVQNPRLRIRSWFLFTARKHLNFEGVYKLLIVSDCSEYDSARNAEVGCVGVETRM